MSDVAYHSKAEQWWQVELQLLGTNHGTWVHELLGV